jgi:hypothetical protein
MTPDVNEAACIRSVYKERVAGPLSASLFILGPQGTDAGADTDYLPLNDPLDAGGFGDVYIAHVKYLADVGLRFGLR